MSDRLTPVPEEGDYETFKLYVFEMNTVLWEDIVRRLDELIEHEELIDLRGSQG